MSKTELKQDYYSMLEAWPTSSNEDIKKNYFRLAKLYHPDVAGESVESREKFKMINEAYSVLSNPQKRHDYDEFLRKGKVHSHHGIAMQEKDRRSAQLSFTQAKEAIRAGRFDKAVLLIKAARKYDPTNPAYNSWYGFSLAMLGTRLHEARDSCKQAIQMEFYNPDYHANLGVVYFKAGLKSLAIKHFRESLKWDKEHRVARKYMDLVGGSYDRGEGPIDRIAGTVRRLFRR
ncbi:MAG: DnaJ domain-containing protein [Candidatus Krumholzibacteriota bacterium]|nr:DnaJ domain-containing protein [Candidatus Krumholzibacteriota bacterium]